MHHVEVFAGCRQARLGEGFAILFGEKTGGERICAFVVSRIRVLAEVAADFLHADVLTLFRLGQTVPCWLDELAGADSTRWRHSASVSCLHFDESAQNLFVDTVLASSLCDVAIYFSAKSFEPSSFLRGGHTNCWTGRGSDCE